MRNALVLSMTRAPSAAARRAWMRLTLEPAEKKALSTPRKSKRDRSSTRWVLRQAQGERRCLIAGLIKPRLHTVPRIAAREDELAGRRGGKGLTLEADGAECRAATEET